MLQYDKTKELYGKQVIRAIKGNSFGTCLDMIGLRRKMGKHVSRNQKDTPVSHMPQHDKTKEKDGKHAVRNM
jgi:hypothetical protein